MGTYIPRIGESYLFASLIDRVGRYSWAGDRADMMILRRTGAWRLEEREIVELQSRILKAVSPSGIRHWGKFDHKTFWEWVDGYELHT